VRSRFATRLIAERYEAAFSALAAL
jgi:hypothetical protein